MKRISILLLLLLAACPMPEQPQSRTSQPQGFPHGEKGPNLALTAEACGSLDGVVVGDIGNGAVLKPDYVCESNGKAPIGRIKSEEGGPIATETSVCCGPAVEDGDE